MRSVYSQFIEACLGRGPRRLLLPLRHIDKPRHVCQGILSAALHLLCHDTHPCQRNATCKALVLLTCKIFYMQTFTPLVEKCKRLNRAMRIGTNHGSLSARILSYYGDTPRGMVESAFEFADICRCRFWLCDRLENALLLLLHSAVH